MTMRLASAIALVGVLLTTAATANAAGCEGDDCGDTALHTSEYSFAGIRLYRHEVKAWVCENDHVITQLGYRRNAVVKMSVAFLDSVTTDERAGPVNVRNTNYWMQGCAGTEVPTSPWTVQRVYKCHEYQINWTMNGAAAYYGIADLGW